MQHETKKKVVRRKRSYKLILRNKTRLMNFVEEVSKAVEMELWKLQKER